MLFTHTHTDRRAVVAVKAQYEHQFYSNHWPPDPQPPQDVHFFLFTVCFSGCSTKETLSSTKCNSSTLLLRTDAELHHSTGEIHLSISFLVLFRISLMFLMYCHPPLHVGLTIKSLKSQLKIVVVPYWNCNTWRVCVSQERYVASLMPLQKSISPWKSPPQLRPFVQQDFMKTLEKAGPQLTSRLKGDWIGLYRYPHTHLIHNTHMNKILLEVEKK